MLNLVVRREIARLLKVKDLLHFWGVLVSTLIRSNVGAKRQFILSPIADFRKIIAPFSSGIVVACVVCLPT
jgi:hypothetical protein